MPFHFVCDIARKVVFLRREKIEKWLLGSVYFSIGVSLATLLYGMFLDSVQIFSGQFPLIIPLVSSSILFLMYAIFHSTVFRLYDDLQDFVFLNTVLTEAVNNTKQMNESEFELVEEPEITDVAEDAEEQAKSAGAEGSTMCTISDAENSPVSNTTRSTDTMSVSTTFTETLSTEARKTIYKNAILQSIQERLESVKSNRSIPEKELKDACENQAFLAATDFNPDSLDIDSILFQE